MPDYRKGENRNKRVVYFVANTSIMAQHMVNINNVYIGRLFDDIKKMIETGREKSYEMNISIEGEDTFDMATEMFYDLSMREIEYDDERCLIVKVSKEDIKECEDYYFKEHMTPRRRR
jgi:hydrogenase maturation factor HypF (carbamoyltransferase family)